MTPATKPLPHRRRRSVAAAAVLLAALLVTGAALAEMRGLTLVPSHALRAPAARVSPAARGLSDHVSGGVTTDAILQAALGATRRHLRFGMNHRTSLTFDGVEREGNCVEYAHLFGAVFNDLAARHGAGARAWVVRSQARLFGQRVPMRGWTDHDWVLIVDGDGRRYVDPSLDDAGLGWDVSSNVQGGVSPPGARPRSR